MKAWIARIGLCVAVWLLLAIGQMTSGAIIGTVWEFLFEHARWFTMIFYWEGTAPLRDATGIAGLFLMVVAVIVLVLRSRGRRTSGIFSAGSMRTLLTAGALAATPYAGRAIILGYGINLVQLRLNPMRLQHLDATQVETWLPLIWIALWVIGVRLIRTVAAHDARRWAAFSR